MCSAFDHFSDYIHFGGDSGMNMLTGWLLSVISTAFMISLLKGLMPESNVREVGKLVGGLILLFALCEPMTHLEIEPLILQTDAYRSTVEQRTEEYREAYALELCAGIKEESETYIIATAQKMNLLVTPTVHVRFTEAGTPYLDGVELDIPYHKELSDQISLELGIDRARQSWKEGA